MTLRTTTATLALLPLAALGALALAPAAPAAASSKTITVKAVETNFHIALSQKKFSPGHYICHIQRLPISSPQIFARRTISPAIIKRIR